MSTRIFGSGIRRREDPRLITGQAKYTADIQLPHTAFLVFVRSPHAHANIRSIDTSQAEASDGVIRVLTGKQVELGIPCAWLLPDSDLKTPPHLALAKDRTRAKEQSYGEESTNHWSFCLFCR